MKRLEISRLMDEYQDNEFFPEGGCDADPEAVKARVLANMKAPAQQRRLSGRKKLLLAAGLAAVLVLVGAGLPSMVYQLVGRTLRFEQTPNSRSVIYEGGSSCMELEEGRLFFVLGEERTDITDLISADTPYIYDGSDPETGMIYYVIMGGTPENYGWLEWVEVPNPFMAGEAEPAPVSNEEGRFTTYDFRSVGYNEQDERDCYAIGGTGVGALNDGRLKDFPWLVAGAKQLDIPFVDFESEDTRDFTHDEVPSKTS